MPDRLEIVAPGFLRPDRLDRRVPKLVLASQVPDAGDETLLHPRSLSLREATQP